MEGREENHDLRKAIDLELSGKRTPENSELCWLYKNLYSIHLKKWYKLFPQNQILVLVFEEWINNSGNAIDKITQFLDLDSNFQFKRLKCIKNTKKASRSSRLSKFTHNYLNDSFLRKIIDKVNTKKSNAEMSNEEYSYIFSLLLDDIKNVEKMLEKDLSIWKNEKSLSGQSIK